MKTADEMKKQKLNEEELLKVTGGNEEATQTRVVCNELSKGECENYDECTYFKEGFHRGCLFKK